MTQTDKINHLAKAANNIRTAIQALDEVAKSDGTGKYDAAYYRDALREILSADRGETGLDNLIKMLLEGKVVL